MTDDEMQAILQRKRDEQNAMHPPGYYVLTREVANPAHDSRHVYDWSRATKCVPAGTLLQLVQAIDHVSRVFWVLKLSGDTRSYVSETAHPALFVRLLSAAEPVDDENVSNRRRLASGDRGTQLGSAVGQNKHWLGVSGELAQ